MPERVTKHGIDVNGNPYTRQVNPQRGSSMGKKAPAPSPVPPSAVEPDQQREGDASPQTGITRQDRTALLVMPPEHREAWKTRILHGAELQEDTVTLARSLENAGTMNAVMASCFRGKHTQQAQEQLRSIAQAAIDTGMQDDYPDVVAAQATVTWMKGASPRDVQRWLDEVPAENDLGQSLREALESNVMGSTDMVRGIRPIV